MRKSTSLLLAALVASSMFATSAMADAKQGQKFYLKKLAPSCKKDGLKNGASFAAKNDRDTWAEAKTDNKLLDQWKEICPSGASKIEKLSPEDINDLYDFCWQYASDGDVPSCG